MSENMNNSVRCQQLRFLFDKGVSGFRFSPPFTTTLTEAKLRTWFGGHNANAFFFRNAQDRYAGIRLDCQCESCLIHQGIFVVESRVAILANSSGAWSLTRTDRTHAECARRAAATSAAPACTRNRRGRRTGAVAAHHRACRDFTQRSSGGSRRGGGIAAGLRRVFGGI